MLDAAMESPKGIKIKCDSHGEATKLRMNCYSVRAADRKLQAQLREPTDPAYGRSIYDRFILEIDEENSVIIRFIQEEDDYGGYEIEDLE
jgi:hypothetical protein